jgi:hypothetical protein
MLGPENIGGHKMAHYSKILVLDNEVQAQLLESILTERSIPHILCSHHDSAYTGLFERGNGWGHVEAPESYRKEILDMFTELTRPRPNVDDDATQVDAEKDLS